MTAQPQEARSRPGRAPTITYRESASAYTNPEPADPRPVTLIRPSMIFSANSYSTPISPPIGLACLAGVLDKAGYRVALIDCVGQGIETIRKSEDGRFKIQGISTEELLDQIDPTSDVVGVSIMFSQEWPHVKQLIRALRERFPDATLIAGGEAITALPEFSLQDCPELDYLVRGEGEVTLLALVHHLRQGLSVDDLAGISHHKGGTYHQGTQPPRMDDLESFPLPAWEMVDLDPYFLPNFTLGLSHGRNMPLIATRGCPYQCTFCSSPSMWTTRYVMRPAKEVVDEIEHNVHTYGMNSVEFHDLTAIIKKEWILEFAAELKSRKLDITWQMPVGTRSEALDEEVLDAISGTGMDFLAYAPETGSPRMLKLIKKKVKLPRMIASLKAAQRRGLVTKLNMLIGLPDEKRRDVLQSIGFMWRLAAMGIDDCNMTLFTPYPGSELYERLRREGKLSEPNDRYFEDLMAFMDVTLAESRTFCDHIGSRELTFYRLFAMAGFYFIYYLRRPGRLVHLFKLLVLKRRSAVPKSMFEQRIYDAQIRKNLDRQIALAND